MLRRASTTGSKPGSVSSHPGNVGSQNKLYGGYIVLSLLRHGTKQTCGKTTDRVFRTLDQALISLTK